jgi:hypothetical protein
VLHALLLAKNLSDKPLANDLLDIFPLLNCLSVILML